MTGEPVVSFVVAAAANGTIGRDGDMPWRLSSDLRRFKRLTMGKPLVMGRRTFDAIGRALPGRPTFVVTRDADFSARGTTRAAGPREALAAARERAKRDGAFEICVVGGGQIYEALRDEADIVRLTLVEAEIEGDTHFELPSSREWREVSRVRLPAGPNDSHATRYGVFTRR